MQGELPQSGGFQQIRDSSGSIQEGLKDTGGGGLIPLWNVSAECNRYTAKRLAHISQQFRVWCSKGLDEKYKICRSDHCSKQPIEQPNTPTLWTLLDSLGRHPENPTIGGHKVWANEA